MTTLKPIVLNRNATRLWRSAEQHPLGVATLQQWLDERCHPPASEKFRNRPFASFVQ